MVMIVMVMIVMVMTVMVLTVMVLTVMMMTVMVMTVVLMTVRVFNSWKLFSFYQSITKFFHQLSLTFLFSYMLCEEILKDFGMSFLSFHHLTLLLGLFGKKPAHIVQ